MLTDEQKWDFITQAKAMLGDHELLYLVLYGSHLYGVNTPQSDFDVRGVFLPSYESLIMREEVREFNKTTGDNSTKNSSDDIDIKLFSLHKFINLVRQGDSNGLDVLFSPSNEACVIYCHPDIKPFLDNVDKILDIKNTKAYIGYSISQSRKYAIKGSRLGVLKQLKEYLNEKAEIINLSALRLEDIIKDILFRFEDKSYCFIKNIKDIDYLMVCGAAHQLNINLQEFYNRIVNEYDKFGQRAEDAMNNQNVDWKALSHAVRVLYQCLELYKTGAITFPIRERAIVLDIKAGKFEYSYVEDLLYNLLEEVDKQKSLCKLTYDYDKTFVLQELKRLYISL